MLRFKDFLETIKDNDPINIRFECGSYDDILHKNDKIPDVMLNFPVLKYNHSVTPSYPKMEYGHFFTLVRNKYILIDNLLISDFYMNNLGKDEILEIPKDIVLFNVDEDSLDLNKIEDIMYSPDECFDLKDIADGPIYEFCDENKLRVNELEMLVGKNNAVNTHELDDIENLSDLREFLAHEGKFKFYLTNEKEPPTVGFAKELLTKYEKKLLVEFEGKFYDLNKIEKELELKGLFKYKFEGYKNESTLAIFQVNNKNEYKIINFYDIDWGYLDFIENEKEGEFYTFTSSRMFKKTYTLEEIEKVIENKKVIWF